MRKLLVCPLLLILPSFALAWNEKGHMVTARLAWRQLSEAQRAQVLAISKKHPHYQDYLAARRTEGFSESEWVFLRATTWADWVQGRRQFDHPTWHYINYPIVPVGSAVDPAKHEPPAKQENVVNHLAVCMHRIKSGTDEEKAIYMTWLFHLVGDADQPLHCTAIFSERFSEEDRGGNLAMIRISSKPMNLHSIWDGLLGRGITPGEIGKDVQEIEQVMKNKDSEVKKEPEGHQSFESWGREGWELSKKVVYLDGQLKVAVSRSNEDVPEPSAGYAASCGRVARIQIGKAGLRLADQLKKLCL